MKRTLKYALSAILTAAIVMPAVASTDNFPDVPDNHWAFEALQKLKKDGILVGYPDGLFRGNRPASRYELAVAVHACYTNLKTVTDGLDSQIKALSEKLNGVASQSDLQNLRDALTALQNDVNGMKSYGDDIAALKKMAATFEKELQSLGVDVEAMKKDLGDLADRVTRLEKKKPAVQISGDLNLLMLAGNSSSGRPGLDMDGKLTGVDPNYEPAAEIPAGMTKDLTMLQEGAFTFAGTNTEGPKWAGTIVVGNMIDTFSNQSTLPHQPGGYVEGNNDVYIQDFSVKFDSSIVGLNFNADLGRVGYKVSPYMFQRIDNVSYFSNERWDDGLYRFDGGILGFSIGSSKINVFGGSSEDLNTVTSSNAGGTSTPLGFQPLITGVVNGSLSGGDYLTISRLLGINFLSPLTSNGNLNLAYLWLDAEDPIVTNAANGTTANRLSVYGGDLNFTFGKIALSGGYSATDLQYNESNINNVDNAAWHAKIGYSGHGWGLDGGYREVEANYLAPGDWGRLGVLADPTNIEGWQVNAHLKLTKALKLSASGEWDKGVTGSSNAAAGVNPYGGTGFNTGTTINKFDVTLSYQFNPNLDLRVGYQDTEFSGLDSTVTTNQTSNIGDASYKWTTIGFDYGLSDSAKLMIQYQISDISNEYQITNGLGGTGGRFTGGILSTQLTIKF